MRNLKLNKLRLDWKECVPLFCFSWKIPASIVFQACFHCSHNNHVNGSNADKIIQISLCEWNDYESNSFFVIVNKPNNEFEHIPVPHCTGPTCPCVDSIPPTERHSCYVCLVQSMESCPKIHSTKTFICTRILRVTAV